MELRHLRYFVAVAEDLHFTRAAQRIGIGQPPLSQQIRDLEREVGTALFHRHSRRVELTSAGQVFLEEARMILAAAAQAKTRAVRAAAGQTGSLRVGFTGSTAFHPLVPLTIRLYRRAFEDVVLTLREANSLQLRQELVDGLLDVAFLRGVPSMSSDIVVQVLDTEPMVMAVPIGGARRSSVAVALSSFADQPFVLFPRENGPAVHDAIIAACLAAGFSPMRGVEAPQLTSIINLVAAGMGVSLVPASMTQVRVRGVGYHRISGSAPQAQLLLAWRLADRSPTVAQFIAFTQARARGQNPSG